MHFYFGDSSIMAVAAAAADSGSFRSRFASVVAEADALFDVEDDESEPYKSKYAARALLERLLLEAGAAASAAAGEGEGGDAGAAEEVGVAVAQVQRRIGTIDTATEERSRAIPVLEAAADVLVPRAGDWREGALRRRAGCGRGARGAAGAWVYGRRADVCVRGRGGGCARSGRGRHARLQLPRDRAVGPRCAAACVAPVRAATPTCACAYRARIGRSRDALGALHRCAGAYEAAGRARAAADAGSAAHAGARLDVETQSTLCMFYFCQACAERADGGVCVWGGGGHVLCAQSGIRAPGLSPPRVALHREHADAAAACGARGGGL